MRTPWGESQYIEPIGPGIDFVGTAGHGGIHLDRARTAAIKAKFPNFVPFTREYAWWEEDCDVALVIVTFPEFFSSDNVARAKLQVLNDKYFASCREAVAA